MRFTPDALIPFSQHGYGFIIVNEFDLEESYLHIPASKIAAIENDSSLKMHHGDMVEAFLHFVKKRPLYPGEKNYTFLLSEDFSEVDQDKQLI